MTTLQNFRDTLLVKFFASTLMAFIITFSLAILGAFSAEFIPELYEHYINSEFENENTAEKLTKAEKKINEENKPELRTGAKYYLLGSVLFLIIYLLRGYALSRKVQIQENRLLNAISNMPPADIMDTFELLMKAIRKYKSSLISHLDSPVSDVKSPPSIEEGIRTCLDALCILANKFQLKNDKRIRYAANIMLFRNIESESNDNLKEIYNSIRPLTDISSFECLQNEIEGVLELVHQLSASTDTKHLDEDDKLPKYFALPIPKHSISQNNGKSRALPGAPAAFLGKPQLIYDAHKILDDYDQRKDYEITRGVFENLAEYFNKKEGKNSRSIFSTAIEYKHSNKRIGVVNLHTNEPRLFPTDKVFWQYNSLILPILFEISDLTSMLLSNTILPQEGDRS